MQRRSGWKDLLVLEMQVLQQLQYLVLAVVLCRIQYLQGKRSAVWCTSRFLWHCRHVWVQLAVGRSSLSLSLSRAVGGRMSTALKERQRQKDKKRIKENNTQDSNVVPHRSTN